MLDKAIQKEYDTILHQYVKIGVLSVCPFFRVQGYCTTKCRAWQEGNLRDAVRCALAKAADAFVHFKEPQLS